MKYILLSSKWKIIQISFIIILVFAFGVRSRGQTAFTATYTFPNDANQNVLSFAYNGTVYAGINPGNIVKVGVNTSSSQTNFRATNWPTGATDGSNAFTGTVDLGKYIGFTIDAVSGYRFTVTSINFGIGRSATGTRQSQWRGSADTYGSIIDSYTNLAAGITNGSGILTNTDVNGSYTGNLLVPGTSYVNIATGGFRYYLFNAESTVGTAGLQGPITISGTFSPCAGLWLGTTSTNWHDATNWCDGTVPISSTDVIINSGGNQPVIGAAAVCNSLTINAGVTVTNNSTLTLGGNLSGAGTFTNASGSALHLGGNSSVSTFTTTATGNTVDYSGNNQTIRAGYYYHLQTSSSGTKTMNGYTDVSGVLGIGPGTTFATASNDLALKGDFTNGGVFSGGSSLIWLAGAGKICTLDGFATTGQVVVFNPSGTCILTGSTSAGILRFGENGASLRVNSTLNVGTVITNNAPGYNCTYTLDGSGTLSCTDFTIGSDELPSANVSHTLNSTLAALVVSNNLNVKSYTNGGRTGQGTFNHNWGTVTVNGTLSLSNTGASNISTYAMGNSTVLNLGGATPFTLSGTGTCVTTLNGTGALVIYNRSGAQNVLATSYTNLVLLGGNTKTFTGITAISTNTAIESGTKADLGTYTSSSNSLTLAPQGSHDGSWGGTGSDATYINTDYFAPNTGILNVAVSTCVAPPTAAGLSNQERCGDGDVTFTVTDPGTGFTVEWSTDGSTNDDGTGLTKTKAVTVASPVTEYARIRNNTTFCTSAWSAEYTGTAHPVPTITFTATTASGSDATANGTPEAIAVNICQGGYLNLRGYSSAPGAGVGVIETHTSSGNVTSGGGGVPTGPTADYDITPGAASAFFSNTYSNYGLSSGTSGTITQTFTPYYDGNNTGSYEAGIDCLGSEITLKYYIYAVPVAAAGPNQAKCDTNTFTMAAVPSAGTGEWTLVDGPSYGIYIDTKTSAVTTVTIWIYDQDFTLRWTETNGSCSSYDDVVIRNNSLPLPASGLANQTVTIPPDAGSVTFTVVNPGAGYSVEWSTDSIILDGPPIAGSTPPVPDSIKISHPVSVGFPITEYARISNNKTGCKSYWGYDYHGTAYNGNLPRVVGSTRYGQSNGLGSFDFVDKNGRLSDIPLLSNYGQDFSRVSTNESALTVILEWARFTGQGTTAEAFYRIPVSSTPVLARGVCWGTTETPDIYGPHTVDGSGVLDHTSTITGIDISPTYYVRAWAINSSGLHYSDYLEITGGTK